MTLIVETGTGLADAESYGSVAGGDTYFDNHGSPTEWTSAVTSEKESALRYATEWLDANFFWYSTLYTITQALNWPRNQYISEDGRTVAVGVPQAVVYATYEMALEHLKDSLNYNDSEGIASEDIGSSSVVYKGNGSKSYSAIKLKLRMYGSGGRASVSEIFRG